MHWPPTTEQFAQLRETLWALDGVKDIGDVMRPLGALASTTEPDDGR